jgi:UPF0755 protein
MRRRGGCLVLILLLAVLAVFMVRNWGGSGPKEDLVFIVEQGASLKSAARQLEKAGAIDSAGRFTTYARLFGSGTSIKPGEYKISKGMSAAKVLELLQAGKTMQRFVVIPEGMPSILVAERLMKAPFLTGEINAPAEGSILPDNYSYVRGEKRSAVLKRMQTAMSAELATLWAQRKPTSVARSPEEAIILAAIVEKETGKASERRMVAGVYSNRVRLGMKLQADPTVIYPVTKGKPLGRRILKSELVADNGYNTYARAGLPIGPIANPGKASIAAVLDPLPTRNLFFVADGTGGHVFAETGAGHNANVQKWYALRRARGEM